MYINHFSCFVLISRNIDGFQIKQFTRLSEFIKNLINEYWSITGTFTLHVCLKKTRSQHDHTQLTGWMKIMNALGGWLYYSPITFLTGAYNQVQIMTRVHLSLAKQTTVNSA